MDGIDWSGAYRFLEIIVITGPTVLALLAGVALAFVARARLGARASWFAAAGFFLLLLAKVLAVTWSVLLPSIVAASGSSFKEIELTLALTQTVFGLIDAAGIGLLITALVVRRPSAGQAASPTPAGSSETATGSPFPPPPSFPSPPSSPPLSG